MFCPQCQGEFVPGIEVCNNCQVPLVPQLDLPPEVDGEFFEDEAEGEPLADLVTVFESGNSASLAIAGSLLDEQGIPYSGGSGGGEGVQDLFGCGRLGPFNFNLLLGPVQIKVHERDAELARELLRELETPLAEGELTPAE